MLAWPTHALELRLVLRVDIEVGPDRVAHARGRDRAAASSSVPRVVVATRSLAERLAPQATGGRGSRRAAPPLAALPVLGASSAPTAAGHQHAPLRVRPRAKGTFSLEDDRGEAPHRLAVWSCNQPYETDEAGAAMFQPRGARFP